MDAGTIFESARNEQVAVTATQTQVSGPRYSLENPRKVITIRNISSNAADIITLTFGLVNSVSNAGIVLRPYDTWTDSNDGAYTCYQDQINAICATANGQLAVFER